MALIGRSELEGALWRFMRGTASEWDVALVAGAMLNASRPDESHYDDNGKYIPRPLRLGPDEKVMRRKF